MIKSGTFLNKESTAYEFIHKQKVKHLTCRQAMAVVRYLKA